MLSHEKMDFISRFIEFTKDYESPTSFWRWGAYTLVAAILRDNCFYNHGLFQTYPNLYVVLLAESAEYRKSGPFKPISKLVRDLKNTKVIEGRASVQGIIDELSQDVGVKNSLQPIRGGSAIILAEELAAFYVQDPQLIPLITTMYDFKEEFPYKLRTSSIVVKNLCLTMLAASNSEFLRTVYTTAAKFGGLLGRTLMVKPDETRAANDLLDVDLDKYDFTPLVLHLEEIKKLKGAFEVNKAAKVLYRDWYNDLYKSYKKFPDSTGITQRIHSNVLRIAMILAASNVSLDIQIKHFEEAISRVTELKPNYELFAMSVGKSSQAEIGAVLLNALWESKDKKLTRKQILFKHWNEFTAKDLDELIITLEQAGLILSIADANELYYSMTPRCVAVFERKT